MTKIGAADWVHVSCSFAFYALEKNSGVISERRCPSINEVQRSETGETSDRTSHVVGQSAGVRTASDQLQPGAADAGVQ